MNGVDKTDYSRWRMLDEDGKHTWHYLDDDGVARKWPQTLADKYYLGLPLVSPPYAINFLQWPGLQVPNSNLI
jgi:lanosterol synthase